MQVTRVNMSVSVQRFLTTRWCLGIGLLLLGGANLLFAQYIVLHTNVLFNDPQANVWLILGAGMMMAATGFAVLTEPQDQTQNAFPLAVLVMLAAVLAGFFLLCMQLQDWWIDDAGITFAYSRSLAEGIGLRAQPWLPPEEGYSSSAWMVLLAMANRMGADIPIAAKIIAVVFSAVAMVLSAVIVARETRSVLAPLLCAIGIACAPTVVWSVSGQEHSLQSLLLLIVVLCAYVTPHWRWPAALVLSVFVITRPEAPVIVIAVFLAAVGLSRREGRPLINAADAAVALLPFATFVGLMIFRIVYFGDFLPNPYYAKSSVASFSGLLNLLGGGWTYVFSALQDSGLLLILALAFFAWRTPIPRWGIVALAILLAQLTFVIWAKGDWMQQYRFFMPVLPVLMVVAPLGLRYLTSYRLRAGLSVFAALLVIHSACIGLGRFNIRPTTPMASVTLVGDAFDLLGERLGIDDPMLAHHDAGGISYYRMVRLLDLGGLVNRTIGRNMLDAAALQDYLLKEQRPHFFFGARNFASATAFTDDSLLLRDYVPLRIVGSPDLRSPMSFIRRDIVTEAENVQLIRDDSGALLRVRVDFRDEIAALKALR